MNKKKFEEIITLQRGYDLPEKDRIPGVIPLIASTGIASFINESKCDGPGVITGRSGSIGKVIYTNNSYWPLNTTLFVKDFHGNNPRYISYWLSMFSLLKYANGASVPTLNRNELTGIECYIHSMKEQQHIVNTIGSVDDLIENYEKQLETIYNLLKVSLSNYSEKVSISYYNPEIIKSGVKKFTDKKEYIDTSAINGINNINTTSQITYNKRPSRANMQPTPNSCWFAKMKGSYKFLVLSYLDNDIISSCILSTGFLGIKVNSKLPLSLLTTIMISDSFTLQRDLNSVGTTMSGVNNQTFKKILVPKLTEEEIEQYDNKYKCLIYRMSYLRKQINFLLTIKQTLLSKYF